MKQPKEKAVEYLEKLKDLPYKTRLDCAVYTIDEVKEAIDLALKTQKEEYEKKIKELKEVLGNEFLSNNAIDIRGLKQENTKLKKEIDSLKKFISLVDKSFIYEEEYQYYYLNKDYWKKLKKKLKKVKK